MNNLNTSLEKNFSTITSFRDGLETLSTKIGKRGGRSFILSNAQGQDLTFKMKDLVQHLDYLIIKDKKTQKPNIQAWLETKSALVTIDIEAEKQLSKENLRVRFFTLLRRILNIFKRSHFKSLNHIIDIHTDSPKLREMYTKLKKLMPNKNILKNIHEITRKLLNSSNKDEFNKTSAEFDGNGKALAPLYSFYENDCMSDRYLFSRNLVKYQMDYGFTYVMLAMMGTLRTEQDKVNPAKEFEAYMNDFVTRDKGVIDDMIFKNKKGT